VDQGPNLGVDSIHISVSRILPARIVSVAVQYAALSNVEDANSRSRSSATIPGIGSDHFDRLHRDANVQPISTPPAKLLLTFAEPLAMCFTLTVEG